MTIKMSVLQEFDLAKINFKAPMCRFCLKHDFSLQKLFISESKDSKESTRGIVNKIFVSTGLKLQPDDKLPNFVCKTCLNKLASYLDFRNQCLEANRILNIAIFKGSDCLHNEETAYNINFTEAETELSDCEEDSSSPPVYNQLTADLFRHLIPKIKQQEPTVVEITVPTSPHNLNSSIFNKNVKLEIIDQLNKSSPKSDIQIISDIQLNLNNQVPRKIFTFDDENRKMQEDDLTVGLELEIRSDNSPSTTRTRKHQQEQHQVVQQITQNDAELFSIEPVNINLNYDCEKDISVFTIAENDQNANGHESDSGITTESSGCTIVQPVVPVNFGKRKMRHKCSYCGILTNDLTNHLLTHQDSGIRKRRLSHDEIEEKTTFPCSLCVRTFATDSSLKCHFASHTREKNFICPVCSKSCAYKYTLSSHMRIHGIYQEIFSCDICQKTFRAKGEIVPHKKLVHGIEPHEKHRKPRGPNKKQKSYN